MRILLIGEYSRLHNSLKEALIHLGHEVTLVGNGDGFKDFPVDHNIDAKISKKGIVNIARQAVFRIFKYDFAAVEYGIRFHRLLPQLKDYDVVQLIGESPIRTTIRFEFSLLKKIHSQNKKMFLLSSGTDVVFVKAAVEKKFRYSLYDPYLKDKSVVDEYRFFLQNMSEPFKNHHKKVYELINGVIATDMDYAIALDGYPKYLGLIPNPVNTEKIPFEEWKISGKIVIFHGINRWNYHKKGIVFFEQALKIIQKKYPEKIKVITVDTLPYKQYIKLYDEAHILLDQVYAYDQGYNALEAMAKGKVVFTGAEREFSEYYNLKERVAVNALPDVNEIVNELSFLIENPEEITLMGKRARTFIEKEHDYLKIAKKYLEVWSQH